MVTMRTHCPPHNVGGPPTLFSTNTVPLQYIGGGGEPHDILVSATILIKVDQQLPPACSSFKVGGVGSKEHNNVAPFAKPFVMVILL